LLSPGNGVVWYSGTFVATKGRNSRPLVAEALPYATRLTPSLSPDGRFAVVTVPHEQGAQIPPEWKKYTGLETPVTLMEGNATDRLQKFVLFDTQTGKGTPILDLPVGPFTVEPTSFWSADGKRVVLVNTSLPLTEDVENRKKKGYIIDYEIATRKWTVLETTSNERGERVTRAGWLKEGKELLVSRVDKARKPAEGTLYELSDSGWTAKTVPASTAPPKPPKPVLADGLKVLIKETANDPPMAVATDGKTEVTLIGQDPALDGVRRAKYQEVKWNERNGHVQTGGLYLPLDEGRGKKPYPLVIQINVSNKDRFWPDGASRTAFAAQALAAQGIAVLQLRPSLPDSAYQAFKDKSGRPYTEANAAQWMQSQAFVDRVDAAVEELGGAGMVDPKRVGVIGFSYTGYLTYYVATHTKQTIPAAAIVADSGLRDYGGYVGFPDDNSAGRIEIERDFGGSFWDVEARKLWLEHVPSFNVDKLETPMMFVYNVAQKDAGYQAKFLTELWGVFKINRREKDLFIIPDGVHQLARPKQRQASLQATVDWMTFWLLGKEIDPNKNEARQEQYYYWRQLRKQRDDRWAKNGNPWDKLAKQNTAASSTTPAKKDGNSNSAEKPDDQ
jgi:dipeptidyl aminopeptidase/acylaminoacyl peptidase